MPPGLSVKGPQNFLGREDTVILSFLEDGDTAEVGIGEKYPVIESR
jgi:hypothetical protein